MNNRINYLDITKGLLILEVIFIHEAYYFGNFPNCTGFSSIVIEFGKYGIFSYFMAAFFILHGYYSNMDKTFNDECIYCIKSLIVPMILVMLYIRFWFCWAMFFSLLAFNLLKRIKPFQLQLVCVCLLSFLGLWLFYHNLNVLYIAYAFAFLPFLYVGKYFRKLVSNTYVGLSCILIYSIINILYFISRETPPLVTGIGFFECSILSFPVFYILAITGTGSLIVISRVINSCRPLEFIGQNSLLYCLIHKSIFGHLSPHFNLSSILCFTDNLFLSFTSYILLFIVTIVITTFLIKIINQYFPFIGGKLKS